MARLTINEMRKLSRRQLLDHFHSTTSDQAIARTVIGEHMGRDGYLVFSSWCAALDKLEPVFSPVIRLSERTKKKREHHLIYKPFKTAEDYDVGEECARYLYVSVDSEENSAIPELASLFNEHPEHKETIERLSNGARYGSLHKECKHSLHIVRGVYKDAWCRQHPGEEDKWERRRVL